jgi:hypothetical protein
MATYDITRNMIPSRYGDADQWISANDFDGAGFEWIELRMKCRYTRRVERFSVLYQGPGGTMRLEQGGPQVAGPVGGFIAQASVIASSPVARARYIDVEAGDVLVINGQRLVILDDRPHGYPRIVSEVEVGLEMARSYLKALMSNACLSKTEGDQIRFNTLRDAYFNLGSLAEELRQKYATR